MTLIEWKEQYSLGVPAVDHEHRALVDLINSIGGEMLNIGLLPDIAFQP